MGACENLSLEAAKLSTGTLKNKKEDNWRVVSTQWRKSITQRLNSWPADKPDMEKRDAAMALDSFDELHDLSQDVMIPLDGTKKNHPYNINDSKRTVHCTRHMQNTPNDTNLSVNLPITMFVSGK